MATFYIWIYTPPPQKHHTTFGYFFTSIQCRLVNYKLKPQYSQPITPPTPTKHHSPTHPTTLPTNYHQPDPITPLPPHHPPNELDASLQILSGFPCHLVLGFYLGNTIFWYENLAHNRSPCARYWVDGLQFGEHIVPFLYFCCYS